MSHNDKPVFSKAIKERLASMGILPKNERKDYLNPDRTIYFYEPTAIFLQAFNQIVSEARI